jgi:hypothetical protein
VRVCGYLHSFGEHGVCVFRAALRPPDPSRMNHMLTPFRQGATFYCMFYPGGLEFLTQRSSDVFQYRGSGHAYHADPGNDAPQLAPSLGLTCLLTLRPHFQRFTFKLRESPKFFMSRGQDAKAVDMMEQIASFNRTTTNLTVDQLTAVEAMYGVKKQQLSASAAVNRKLEKFKLDHVRSLFRTKKLAYSSSLVILIWALIGLAFPLYNAFLPYFLQTRGADLSGSSSTYIT